MAPKKRSQCYKVVLIGEIDVGKSSLFVRFRDGRFVETLQSTISLDHTTQEVSYKGKNGKGAVDVQLWDTAGLERTGFMTNNYYVHSRAVILMYDVGDLSSLNILQGWYDDAKQYCPNEQSGMYVTKFFLLGNKIDENNAEGSEQQAMNFAQKIKLPKEHVFRVSVKTGKGMDTFLNDIALILSETKLPEPQGNIILGDDDEEDKSNCPC